MKRNIQRLFLLLGFLTTQSACSDLPKEYSAEAIEAQVVDAETKKPIEGVIVTINWQLLGGFEGGNVLGQMKVMETVTDKTGRFYFPAWGPERRTRGYLREAPQLLLFKSGYEYRRLANEYRFTPEERSQEVRRSDWNGKTIELRLFKGAMDEWARQLGLLMTSLRFVEDDCNWKKTPRIILALGLEEEKLRGSGIIRSFYSVDYVRTDEKKCGSPKEFFKAYHP